MPFLFSSFYMLKKHDEMEKSPWINIKKKEPKHLKFQMITLNTFNFKHFFIPTKMDDILSNKEKKQK